MTSRRRVPFALGMPSFSLDPGERAVVPAITLGEAEQGARKLLQDALRRYRRRDHGAIIKLLQDNPAFAQDPRVKAARHQIAKLARPKKSRGRPRGHPISPYVVAGEVERVLERGRAKSKRDAYKQIARQRSSRRKGTQVNPETIKRLHRAAYSDPAGRPQLVLGEEIMPISWQHEYLTQSQEGLKEGYLIETIEIDLGHKSIRVPFGLCEIANRENKTLVIRYPPDGRFEFQLKAKRQDTVEDVELLREKKALRLDYRITTPDENVGSVVSIEILFEDTAR